MDYHSKKRKYRLKPIPTILAVIGVILIIWLVVFLMKQAKTDKTVDVSSISSVENSSQLSSADSSEESSQPSSEESSSSISSVSPVSSVSSVSSVSTGENDPYVETVGGKDAWNLVLLNRTNSISKDMSISKSRFNTEWIDARVAPAYKAMFDAAQKEGITLFLRSGYRSINTQRINYQSDINRNMANGYTEEQATLLTEQYYARPGQSEHHTGLALDLITPEYHNSIHTLDERFAKTDAFKWLTAHCAEYGFVLRYAADKVDITKINYEPWHYRYVGVTHAKYMQEHNLALEEYLQ